MISFARFKTHMVVHYALIFTLWVHENENNTIRQLLGVFAPRTPSKGSAPCTQPQTQFAPR